MISVLNFLKKEKDDGERKKKERKKGRDVSEYHLLIILPVDLEGISYYKMTSVF